MGNWWRTGLFVGLAILGGQTVAAAQSQTGGDADDGSTPASGSVSTAVVVAPQTGSVAVMPVVVVPPPTPSSLAAIGPPSASATAAAAVAIRRRAKPSFNRVVTTRRTTPAAGVSRREATAGAMGENDPLRPYSAQVRDSNLRSATSTSRQQPRVAMQPRSVQYSRSYYPAMRVSQHPNANVPQVNSSGMGMMMGMGMGMGGRHCTPSRGAVMGGGAGRGR